MTIPINAQRFSTLAQIFRRHGISLAYTAPIMEIHELAMAINLVGRHEVAVDYRASVASPGGHELWVLHLPRGAKFGTGRTSHIIAPLPSDSSTEEQRGESITALQGIVHQLSDLLEEGEKS